jgi:hypothetical protein
MYLSGGKMNHFFVACLFLSPTLAFAGTEPLKKQIPVEDAIGKYEINMDFVMERPVTESIHMDVSILCNDHRANPNSAKPKTEKVLEGEKICAFDDYKFDKDSKILTLRYSTGQFDKNDEPSCDDHWERQIDTKQVCESWQGDGTRKPASDEVADSDEEFTKDTEFSSRRHHRGVHSRTRVSREQYSNSNWDFRDPRFENNYVFNGGMFGTQEKYKGRDGLPRNSRREVIGCPHLGLSSCLSAIFAAETSCQLNVHHGHHGFGPCAIEDDARRHRFGPACDEIHSMSGQATCCNQILATAGKRYFGARTKRIAGSACGWR